MTATRVNHKHVASQLSEERWRKVGEYGNEHSAVMMVSRIKFGRVAAYVGLPVRVKIRAGLQVWAKLDPAVPVVEARK